MTSFNLVALTLMVSLSASFAHAGLYRWVDDAGKVHFSDKIPPSMAQTAQASGDKDALEVKPDKPSDQLEKLSEPDVVELEGPVVEIDPALSEEEEKRLDEELLEAYDSRQDIIANFNKKLSLQDQNMSILTARDESLTQKLAILNKKKQRASNEVTKLGLSGMIATTHESLLEYRAAIEASEGDRAIIMNDYRETLKRFDRLSNSSDSLVR